MNQPIIRSLREVITYFQDTMAGHPKREALDAYRAIRIRNRSTPYQAWHEPSKKCM